MLSQVQRCPITEHWQLSIQEQENSNSSRSISSKLKLSWPQKPSGESAKFKLAAKAEISIQNIVSVVPERIRCRTVYVGTSGRFFRERCEASTSDGVSREGDVLSHDVNPLYPRWVRHSGIRAPSVCRYFTKKASSGNAYKDGSTCRVETATCSSRMWRRFILSCFSFKWRCPGSITRQKNPRKRIAMLVTTAVYCNGVSHTWSRNKRRLQPWQRPNYPVSQRIPS